MATVWFEKGRPALFEALSNVCDQIEDDILYNQRADDSKARELQEQHDAVAKLRTENDLLRQQLATLKSSYETSSTAAQSSESKSSDHVSSDAVPEPSDVPTSSVISNAPTASGLAKCRGDCPKILRRYHALSTNFKTAKDALQRRKDERNKWIQRAEYLGKKIQAAEEQYGIRILDQKAYSMDIPSATAREADETIFPLELSFTAEATPVDSEPQLPDLLPRDVAEEPPTSIATSSQTTQGEASDDISPPLSALPFSTGNGNHIIKQEPSSDVPEVVSEREIRKRKRADGEIALVAKPRVKSELNASSSPVMSILAAKFHTQDSLDLDDIVQKIQTPRKRQLRAEHEPQTDIFPRSRPETFTHLQNEMPRQSHSAGVSPQFSALMPIDSNTRAIRPASNTLRAKNRMRQLAHGIASLAEDGATYEKTLSVCEAKESGTQSLKNRLDALLSGAVEDTDILPSSSKGVKKFGVGTPTRQAKPGIPGPRQLPFNKDGHLKNQPTATMRTNPRTSNSRFALPQLAHQQLSDILRNKPVSELRLSDFKVNPLPNEGYDYAFSDVVRDKYDRACLPGCVDMHCCGKYFRALAISQRPDSPLTPVQRQEEQKLLEDFLGESSFQDGEERLQLWIEAKMQELANKYAKHRYRFSRMQSPPGFWDADFPDTQRLKADKEEAAKRIKRMVASRYREALKPNGIWKFMDE
ncbi:hypothetical protein QQS21_008414 [Conoideocrella luteorostrata]|uniref:DNA endonuclease activator Ctp1 C-terminal domain-containing protein n=1 Tax=Conoideocrella luteorostrata TaxID=1105319 RepID=A0AAJ0FW16_9HYPO|nr:hypothetical protein QQS21_008414 [Conoideocrella luteorostrata]